MAGCRMVMKGRALARAGYEQELSSIRAFVAMQNKADPGSSGASAESVSQLLLYLRWRWALFRISLFSCTG